ncbi:MAG: PEP-CTERM sorting domain-containing protein [Terrimicrobiaceae bacterium]
MKNIKFLRSSFSGILALSLLFAVKSATAQTILLNGDFETGNFTSWSNGGGSIHSGITAGSTYAALAPGGATEVSQQRTTASISTPSSFTLDMYFAAGLPPDAGKNSLETSILYQGNSSLGMFNMGVTDRTGSGTVGDLWVNNGLAKTVLFADSITYSTDVGGGSEVINTYRIRVTFNSLTDTYDVGLSSLGGSTFTQTALNQSIWITAPTITNPTSLEVKLIGGNSGGPPANQGVGLFDNVYLGSALAVPEPSSLALFGIASAFVLWRKRRPFLS